MWRVDYLKQDEVYEREHEAGAIEPEEVVPGLNNWYSFHDLTPLFNFETHLRNDRL